MNQYLEALEGISYIEWMKVKMAVDAEFRKETGKFESNLKLTSSEGPKQFIRSQFGK